MAEPGKIYPTESGNSKLVSNVISVLRVNARRPLDGSISKDVVTNPFFLPRCHPMQGNTRISPMVAGKRTPERSRENHPEDRSGERS